MTCPFCHYSVAKKISFQNTHKYAQSCRQSFAGCRVCRCWRGFHFLASGFPNSLRITLRVLKETPTMQFSHPQGNTLCLVAVFKCRTDPVKFVFLVSRCRSCRIVSVVNKYEERLRRCPYVPRFSYGRPMQSDNGGPNRCFLHYIFCDQSVAIAFLKDTGLLRSTMLCNTSGRDMTWSTASNIHRDFDGGDTGRLLGSSAISLRPSSKGRGSNRVISPSKRFCSLHTTPVCCEPATKIQSEYRLSSYTVADWGMFCRETMLVFLEGCYVKLGGTNTTVKIDESKVGRRKYHREHTVKGQWLFGGVEGGSDKTFLVTVSDRTAHTLMTIIRDWIKPGTTVIRDSWAAYRDLGAQGYTHCTVNHSIQ